MQVPSVWDDPKVEVRLRELWLKGLSASQTATELNHEFRVALTRNAVIGKLHRMGVKNVKRKVIKAKVEAKVREFKIRTLPVFVIPPPKPPPQSPSKFRTVSIANLRDNICHFLLDGGRYCGQGVQIRSSYCPHHHDLMHVKNEKRK